MKSDTNDLDKIEQNFKELIIKQCKFCQFDKYLEENPNFEFPKITEDLLKSDAQSFIAIPGLFGGFTYYFEKVNNKPILYAEQSSRMNHSSDDYVYFEITAARSRVLENGARESARQKFWDLAKKAHAERKRRIESAGTQTSRIDQ